MTTLPPKPPSEKQVRAAKTISNVLHIPMPESYTAKAYWQFINDNMEASKRKRQRHVWRYRAVQHNTRKSRYYAQKEADWQAVHLNGDVWAKGVLDGTIALPSWMHDRSPADYQKHLRALGYRSTLEDELAAERSRDWYGLEGSPDIWD